MTSSLFNYSEIITEEPEFLKLYRSQTAAIPHYVDQDLLSLLKKHLDHYVRQGHIYAYSGKPYPFLTVNDEFQMVRDPIVQAAIDQVIAKMDYFCYSHGWMQDISVEISQVVVDSIWFRLTETQLS